jgi:nitrous oxidase accessory protein
VRTLRFVTLLIVALVGASAAAQTTVTVCSSCEQTDLHAAIAQAEAGDRIVLGAGTYRLGTVVIDRPLELIGDGWPVLDGERIHEILTIVADDVTVRGIEFRNSGVSHVDDLAALKTDDVENCHIEGNRFYDNFFAIYIGKARHCAVVDNEVIGQAESEVFSGNAIHLWNSYDVRVEGNTVAGHRDGIYLEFVRGSVVEDNISEDNLRYGLHFMFSHENSFRTNSFVRNGAGVAVMYSKQIEMIDNIFEDNWGASAYGLLLKEIDDSVISGNTFDRNTVGVYIDGSNRTDIDRNDFVNNGYAMRVLSSSQAVRIMHNNFLGNTFDVVTNGGRSYNAFLENHWSTYQGYDLNRDVIGDVPYRPVRLFAQTVENYPQTIILLRSPLEQFMEYAERVLPIFTPKTIEDDRPFMRELQWLPSTP